MTNESRENKNNTTTNRDMNFLNEKGNGKNTVPIHNIICLNKQYFTDALDLL